MSTDWGDLYETVYPQLVRFLYRFVWDEDRARDLAQDVFVRALRHRPDDPRAWLFAVARNLARDEARTALRRRRHLRLVRDEAKQAESAAQAASERLERHEAVRRALGALTERDREILLLWDAGLSYDEIAVQTGLARGAIGTTLSRARRRLVAAHEELEAGDVSHP